MLQKASVEENPTAITGDEMYFVSAILNNRNALNHVLPEKFIQQIWERLLLANVSVCRNNLVISCLLVSDLTEYAWIIKHLCSWIEVSNVSIIFVCVCVNMCMYMIF